MKVYFVIISLIFFAKSTAMCQGFTLNGFETDKIYIGLENKIKFQNTAELLSIRSASFHIRVHKEEKEILLYGVKNSKRNPIFIEFENSEIDTIYLDVERLVFKQFVKGIDGFAMLPGTYPKSILTKMQSVLVRFNCPWVESPIVGFKILIRNGDDILYKGSHNGGSLMKPEIRDAIALLKSKGTVEITNIYARVPYDDGERPKDMIFICE